MVQILAVQQIDAEKKIQSKMTTVRGRKIELRKLRDELKSTFMQDKAFHDQDLKLSDERKKLKEIKDKLADVPAVQDLYSKIDKVKGNLESDQLTLDSYLLDYVDKTKKNTIPDDTGKILKIVVKKVVKTTEV